MKHKQILSIVIKVIGLYLFFMTIGPFFTTFISTIALVFNKYDYFELMMVLSSYVAFTISFTLSYLFLFWTERIVNIIHKESDEEIILNLKKQEIIELALIVIGLTLIVYAISYILPFIVEFIYKRNTDKQLFNDTSYSIKIYSYIGQLIIGIIAIIKARSISDWIFRKDKLDNE